MEKTILDIIKRTGKDCVVFTAYPYAVQNSKEARSFQAETCKKFAARYGMNVREIFGECIGFGEHAIQKEFKRMLVYMAEKNIEIIVVTHPGKLPLTYNNSYANFLLIHSRDYVVMLAEDNAILTREHVDREIAKARRRENEKENPNKWDYKTMIKKLKKGKP